MRLGELLISEGLLTQRGLEEALEAQVVNGGRLGTNLVELGLVQEKDLARVLGKQHATPFASGEMKADPKALAVLDPDFSDEKDVLPMRVDATRLSIAMIDPRDIETLDAVAFKTGKRVTAVVVPEFRMNQLLRRYCKAFRPLRAIDMNVVRQSRTLATQEGGGAAAPGDLMSEEEFQSLYAKAMSGGDEAAEPAPQAVPEPPPAVRAPPPIAAGPASRPTEPEPEAAPLSFAEAQALLKTSNDREDVARTVLRFALGKWKRALLFSVQGEFLTGWHGVGQGIREKAVRRIGVALRGNNTFKLVRDTRSHYIGPMRRDAGTAVFYKLLGGGYPTTAVMLPLLVRSKLVHILYVDNGPDQLTPPDVGELLILSQSVARSYEAMIARRRKGG